MLDGSALPAGWTLERVRSMEPHAALLDPAEHYVAVAELPDADCQVIHPTVILGFSGPCLCLAAVDGSADWWMGQLDPLDGSIVCWASYALEGDLADAIRSL